jgi:hypothetical protein
MSKKAKRKRTKEPSSAGRKKEAFRISFKKVMRTKLPKSLESICQPFWLIGAAFLSAAVVQAIMPSLRRLAPLTLLIALIVFAYAFLRKREIVVKGYDEFIFKVIDYSYLTRFGKKPTGLLLLGPFDRETDKEIYHISLFGKEAIPPTDWLIRVYVPKDAVVAEFQGRKYFSSYYGFQIVEE